MGSDFDENTVVDDSVTDENIRKLVMRELENCSEEKTKQDEACFRWNGANSSRTGSSTGTAAAEPPAEPLAEPVALPEEPVSE